MAGKDPDPSDPTQAGQRDPAPKGKLDSFRASDDIGGQGFVGLLIEALRLGAGRTTKRQFPRYAGVVLYIGLAALMIGAFGDSAQSNIVVMASAFLVAAVVLLLLLVDHLSKPVAAILIFIVVIGLGTAAVYLTNKANAQQLDKVAEPPKGPRRVQGVVRYQDDSAAAGLEVSYNTAEYSRRTNQRGVFDLDVPESRIARDSFDLVITVAGRDVVIRVPAEAPSVVIAKPVATARVQPQLPESVRRLLVSGARDTGQARRHLSQRLYQQAFDQSRKLLNSAAAIPAEPRGWRDTLRGIETAMTDILEKAQTGIAARDAALGQLINDSKRIEKLSEDLLKNGRVCRVIDSVNAVAKRRVRFVEVFPGHAIAAGSAAEAVQPLLRLRDSLQESEGLPPRCYVNG